jgi:hypothetical protein
MGLQWDGDERRTGQPPEQLRARLQQLREAWEIAHRDTQVETSKPFALRMFARKKRARNARRDAMLEKLLVAKYAARKALARWTTRIRPHC